MRMSNVAEVAAVIPYRHSDEDSKRNSMTPTERRYLGMARVNLDAKIHKGAAVHYAVSEYNIHVGRADGCALTELELRSVLSNVSWAIDGEESLITLYRVS